MGILIILSIIVCLLISYVYVSVVIVVGVENFGT